MLRVNFSDRVYTQTTLFIKRSKAKGKVRVHITKVGCRIPPGILISADAPIDIKHPMMLKAQIPSDKNLLFLERTIEKFPLSVKEKAILEKPYCLAKRSS